MESRQQTRYKSIQSKSILYKAQSRNKNYWMNNLCFYFWLHRSSLLCGLSLVAANRVFFSNCSAWASCCSGLSCCGAQVLGECASVAVAGGLSSWGSHAIEHGLSSCGTRGLVAPQHVGSWIRDWTHVSCIGRWILHHWATNGVLNESLEWEVLGGTRDVTGKFHVASMFRKDSHEEMLLNWDSKDASQAKRTGKSVLDGTNSTCNARPVARENLTYWKNQKKPRTARTTRVPGKVVKEALERKGRPRLGWDLGHVEDSKL